MNIKEYLIIKDITVPEFSKIVGVSVTYIYQVIRGQRIPSRKVAKQIEDVTLGKIKKESLRNKEILLQKYYDSLEKQA